MYLAVILGVAILETNYFPPHSWGQYLTYVLFFGIAFSPSLTFVLLKERHALPTRPLYYYLLWSLAFVAWPLCVGITAQQVRPFSELISYQEDEFFTIGILFFFLALIQEILKFLQSRSKWLPAIRQFSLEKAFFLVLIMATLFAASLVVSDIESFEEAGIVRMGFNLPKIFSHIGTFLSVLIQFFLLYSVAYLFYLINHRFLVGKLLKQKGILHYIMGGLATVVLLYPIFAQLIMWLPIHQKFQLLAPSENMLPFDFLNGGVAFISLIISLPVILVFQWFQQNNQILGLEKQQIQTELDLLKQQINPHFFFNTLNNLYALSQKQSSQTPEVILQLSDLMRYVIYRGKEERVYVAEEISYLEDYCNLQQIRLHKKLDFRFSTELDDEHLEIPPLLLVVLVENAFKHGIEPAEHDAFLHMNLSIKGKQVDFLCKNSFESGQSEKGGVGLYNLRRRLDLLFGDNYELRQEVKDHIFRVHLSWKNS